MKHTLTVGTWPILIHSYESVQLDASADAVGTVSVPGESVSQALIGSQRFGGYAVKREVVVSLTSGTVAVRVSGEGAAILSAAQQSVGAAPSINQRVILALLGDSLHNQTETTTSLTNGAPSSYSASSGVATFLQTAHGLGTGQLVHISSTSGEVFDQLSVTRIDADNFSVVLPAGLTISTGASWYVARCSNFNEAGPYTFLRPARPKLLNFAASGAVTAQIKVQLPFVLASKANVVWLRAGANDQGAGTAVASVLADITAMATAIVSSGKALILSTTPPIATSVAGGAFTANLRAGVIAISKSLANCYLIDEHAIGVNPTSANGSARANYQQADNTHFTPIYSSLIAAKLQAILDKLYPGNGVSPCPTSALDAYDATNNPTSTQPFPKPTLITTSGGTNGTSTPITGVVAGGIRVDASGGWGAGSVTASVVAAPNGFGNAQQLVGAPTANNDLLRIETRGNGAGASAADVIVAGLVVAGERRKAVAHLKVTGLTGQSVLQSYAMFVVMTTPEGTFQSSYGADHNWAGTVAQQNQTDFETDLESGEFIVPAGLTSIYMDIQLKFGAAGTPVTMQGSQFAYPLVPA